MTLVKQIPVGTIVPCGTVVTPAGYLPCNGAAVSRVTFGGLFASIGIGFGNGDGATTFNVPDLRGRFIRGLDQGAGNDPDAGTRTALNPGGNVGDKVGSLEGGEMPQHNHNVNAGQGNFGLIRTAAPGESVTRTVADISPGEPDITTAPAAIPQAGGSESRPVNVACPYMIKV